jgi:hypothetical protein
MASSKAGCQPQYETALGEDWSQEIRLRFSKANSRNGLSQNAIRLADGGHGIRRPVIYVQGRTVGHLEQQRTDNHAQELCREVPPR